jgi:hypothetical protein
MMVSSGVSVWVVSVAVVGNESTSGEKRLLEMGRRSS